MLTGRWSLATHPWLADHVVQGRVIVPGTAFVELVLHAGERVGASVVRELALEAPLVLPESGGVAVQVVVGGVDGVGGRSVAVYSCVQDGVVGREWVRHGVGVLGSGGLGGGVGVLGEWPPVGGVRLEVGDAYERLGVRGYGYGPVFRGLRGAWRRGDEVFAEVVLPEGVDGSGFGLHPALFDAIFHAGLVEDLDQQTALMPFVWNDVRLHAHGARAVRACVRRLRGDEETSLVAYDLAGDPVVSVRSVVSRPVAIDDIGTRSGHLYRMNWHHVSEPALPADSAGWVEIASGATDGPRRSILGEVGTYPSVGALIHSLDGRAAPPVGAVLDVSAVEEAARGDASDAPAGPNVELPSLVQRIVSVVVAELQAWLRDARLENTRLVIVTRCATRAIDGSDISPAQSPVWGLVRAAQAEHPGRFTLLDIDQNEMSIRGVLAAIGHGGEPELAICEGEILVPRLGEAQPRSDVRARLGAEGTVLITGGTGGLGGALARHLVSEHSVRQLMLLSRRGPAAPGAAELRDELAAAGASVAILACDVADREELARAIEAVPAEHPVTAVIHVAGVSDASPIDSVTDTQIRNVLRAKVDAAWHLHELTAEMSLSAFILFSSAASSVLAAGQASYAAANAFLDGLAEFRSLHGLPGLALAWGPWAEAGGMAGELGESGRQRLARLGTPPMSTAVALATFDAVLSMPQGVIVPVELSGAALRSRSADLPATLRGLVPSQRRSAAIATPERLSDRDVSSPQRVDLMKLVTEQVAAVLGHGDTTAIQPDRPFKELGFDSLAAIELRNQLGSTTGLRLPATLIFDYPTCREVASHLAAELYGQVAPDVAPATDSAQPDHDDPVAIVGMGCRLPGGVTSPEDLWELVWSGADAVGPFPRDRGWDIERLFDPEAERSGTSYVAEGGFLYDAANFDAEFFGISPREALSMDPQQRLVLQTAWETIERAGIDPSGLRGSATGVYAGVMYHDYGPNGSGGSLVSGRVAYHLGLEGPAVTVDTACSSSLVALHQAVQALRSGECSMALAGGVTVMATPAMFVEFSEQRALSPDGRCRAFGEGANGTGWSEGVGLLLLERLSDARAAGRRVLAVVRGSAVNQDGASNGLTAPNGPAQERVIRAALGSAGVGVGDVDVVEGHGTGTSLGDPIEVGALLGTYGRGRGGVGPLWLGSLKSNIGHAQAAAGVAGVIKMVLALRFGWLPRTLHVDVPSGEVDWSSGGVELLREAVEWRSVGGRVRRAGVSSFGISGTNAHVIVEEAPPVEAGVSAGSPVEVSAGEAAAVGGGLPVVLPVSGVGWGGLRGQLGGLVGLVGGGGVGLGDVGWSLGVGRAGLGCRAVVVADGGGVDGGVGGVVGLLSGVAGGGGEVVGVGGSVVLGEVVGGRTVFMFSGQGSQRVGMGRGLYGAFGVFREVFDEVCGVFDGLLGCGLRGVVFEGVGGDVDRTVFAQAGLFAVEVALFRLLESWGVGVDVVVGHSVGEVAAAYVVGVLGLEDACRLVAVRGGLMDGLPSGGVMVAVSGVGEERVRGLLVDGVDVAAVNGGGELVLSGVEECVVSVVGVLEGLGARVSWLRVSHAFHSGLMEPMLGEFGEAIGGLGWGGVSGGVVAVSSVLGGVVGGEWSDPGYWVSQVRSEVRFGDVVGCLRGLGVSRFVEVGPGGVLGGLARRVVEGSEGGVGGLVFASLLGGVGGLGEVEGLLVGVSRVWVSGGVVDWSRVLVGGRWVDLPTYAFQHQRYWLDPMPSGSDVTVVGQQAVGHPLLAAAVPSAVDDGLVLTGRWSMTTHPWLADHQVHGTVVVPGTVFVELGLAAGAWVGCSAIRELVLESPLLLPESGGVAVQVVVADPGGEGERGFVVCSRPEGSSEWVQHARGSLAPNGVAALAATTASERSEAAEPTIGTAADMYAGLAKEGLAYGVEFRRVRSASATAAWTFVELDGDGGGSGQWCGPHPAVLDAAMHPLVSRGGGGAVELPFVWNDVEVHGASHGVVSAAVTRHADDSIGIELRDSEGQLLASVGSVVARPVDREMFRSQRPESMYRVALVPRRPASSSPQPGNLVFLGERDLWSGMGSKARMAAVYPDLDSLGLALAGGAAPELVWWQCDATGTDGFEQQLRDSLSKVLEMIQAWLAGGRFVGMRLMVMTRGGNGERTEIINSAVWGLVRAAEAENPGRFGLVDVDGVGDVAGVVGGLVGEGEPEVVVRGGGVFVPRLVRVSEVAGSVGSGGSVGGFGGGAVLVTGGTGGLGALVARHLVVGCGVRDVVLVSRRGWGAVGVEGLVGELESVGARVRVFGCDVGDREALVGLLGEVGGGLSGVVHAAGVVDDGVVSGLSMERLGRVLSAKVDGAWGLHELLGEVPLIFFSSIAGIAGAAGQGGYAAANAALDGLAEYRRAQGLPAVSLAWGLWENPETVGSQMAGRLGEADLARLARGGIAPLRVEDGLRMFDSALTSDYAALVPARIDVAAVRTSGQPVPAVFRDLVGLGDRGPRAAEELGDAAPGDGKEGWQLLADLSAAERQERLRALIQAEAAQVLGHRDPSAVDLGRGFLDLGFDSLTALELRNRLASVTGEPMPATLIFDHPSVETLATWLESRLFADPADNAGDADGAAEPLARLERLLADSGSSPEQRSALVARLRALVTRWDSTSEREPQSAGLADASAVELFDILDEELGPGAP
nr:type I polyketide synthase [Natronosporangium hydrolyticum]